MYVEIILFQVFNHTFATLYMTQKTIEAKTTIEII